MNIAGKYVETPIEPESCITFNWDDVTKKPEMTEEEMMEEFDRNLDKWGGVDCNG